MTDPRTGAQRIADERQRQIDAEGYTATHDADHGLDELALAASCYALPPAWNRGRHVMAFWPWRAEDWKPSDDRVRELEKAGALIAAAIDSEVAVRTTPDPRVKD